MRQAKKHATEDLCRCVRLPVGWRDRSGSHLRFLFGSSGWEPSYYICPKTGVLWRRVDEGDWKNTYEVYEKTSCRQEALERYTVGTGVVTLYATKQPLPVPRTAAFDPPSYWSEYPELPVAGRLETLILWMDAELDIHCGDVEVSYGRKEWGATLWIYLPQPLARGCTVNCYVCSPFEMVSQQIFRERLHLPLVFTGGTIGEIVVESVLLMERVAYGEWFGFDKDYRELAQEELPPRKRVRRR